MKEVLVFPRDLIQGMDGFILWDDAKWLVDEMSDQSTWMARDRAEIAREWVQPIPCAIFYDVQKRYCVFRQPKQNRKDLSFRFSFIVGGHVDVHSSDTLILKIFSETVKREVKEEIGVSLDQISEPLGLVVDAASLASSRHIGFVYEMPVHGVIKVNTEFAVYSDYNGVFLDIEKISPLKGKFDPWSTILLSEYIARRLSPDLGRQFMLPLFDAL